MISMQELLSRMDNLKATLSEQEVYELRLDDSDDVRRPGYIVKQAHAQWSEVDGQVMWDDFQSEQWPTLAKAKERYEARRRSLAEQGFTCSDMDLL
jgi:hypothetical protein